MSRPRKNPPSYTPPRNAVARVRRFIKQHELFERGDRVLVAVSGGPDSTCLLLILAALRRSLEIDIVAAHFDHELRGKRAAAQERRFVASLADVLGVSLRTGAGDVHSHATKHKLSIEDAARQLRYRFLARVARTSGCGAVAAGHTRDDQAETVLLHILRGAGLRGLAGMGATAPWPMTQRGYAPRLTRPLLALSREDTERCCWEACVQPIDDDSNRSKVYLRNRLRAELLPRLREYNPRIEEALVRLATAAAGDVASLEALGGQAISRDGAGAVRLQRTLFRQMPPALQRHAIRMAYAQVAGDARGLSERHVAALGSVSTGDHLDLPRGVHATVTRDAVVLDKRATPRLAMPSRPVAFDVPGQITAGGWHIEAEVLAGRPRALATTDGLVAVVDAALLGGSLSVRRRRPGDRFQPLGMSRAKKLQDFLVDEGVPRAERDSLPMVCAGDRIVWVPGRRPAEWAKVTRATQAWVRLSARRADA